MSEGSIALHYIKVGTQIAIKMLKTRMYLRKHYVLRLFWQSGYVLTFIIPLQFTLYDNSSFNISVSFTVMEDNNGTSARCLADNGVILIVSDPAGFAYGQGMEYICSHSFISPPCHNTRSPIISSRNTNSD